MEVVLIKKKQNYSKVHLSATDYSSLKQSKYSNLNGNWLNKAMIKVSVIVPVFNGEKYLKPCLYSIARQTIDDMEIIIVENGSTDKSPQIIEKFLKKWSDKRQIVFLQEPQQGNAYARNAGIRYAQGKYLAFVDQDDYIQKDFLEYMHNKAEKSDADVLVSGYRSINEHGHVTRKMVLTEDYWSPFRMTAPWGKLYKRDLIERNKIRFLTVSKGEDVYFSFNAYNCAKRLLSVPEIGYNWFANKNSLSHTEHRHIDAENSIIPLFDKLQNSLYPLKYIQKEYLEYFFIKTIVHETFFCARGKTLEVAYGYFNQMENWIDHYYPENENNEYLGVLTPKGEDIKRRVFVMCFWKLKKWHKVKKCLDLYTKIFK